MKKRKGDDHSHADFKNNPFKSRKGFAPSPPSAVKKITPRSEKDELHEDESKLFLRAVIGTRKISSKAASNVGEVADQGKIELSGQSAAIQDNKLFVEAMQKIGTLFKDVPEQEQEILEMERRSASSRLRQLKRGTILISRQLDLHGFLRNEALRQLDHFISEAFNSGRHAVLVITGKGLNSPEGPVLQGAVAAWLKNQAKGMVVEFAPAPRNLGGRGAFVVFLKRNKTSSF